MKVIIAKVLFLILIVCFFLACHVVKRVPDGQFLLVDNKFNIDEKEIKNDSLSAILLQKPNLKLLKIPLALHVFNLAKANPDSAFYTKFIKDTVKFNNLAKILSEKQVYRLGESFWFKGRHNLFKDIGEAPVIIDGNKTKKTLDRLQQYYFNRGYFNNFGTYTIDSIAQKKAVISYDLTLGHQYKLDSINKKISSIQLDSIYEQLKSQSFLKSGEAYFAESFNKERSRLTKYFRNNGVYNFQKNNILFSIDTINTNKKAHVKLLINNFQKRIGDSIFSFPFKVSRIKKVQVFVDQKKDSDDNTIDSITYKGVNFISKGQLKYKPNAIYNAIFFKLNDIYSDEKVSQTNQVINSLKMFNFPIIQIEEMKDSTGLASNIYLQSKERYGFGFATDIIHNNIQQVGLIGNISFSLRNIFKRAEIFEIGARANIGSSKDIATADDKFFNIFEIGIDTRLIFPRILLPFDTKKIIPYSALPSTTLNAGFSKQTNIGLDKENLTSTLNFNWQPSKKSIFSFDLFSIQYVNNLNIDNYFNVYQSSYDQLNNIAKSYDFSTPYLNESGNLSIPEGANQFISAAIGQSNVSENDVRSVIRILERKVRLTQNNLILSSALSYTINTKNGNTDNSFSMFRTRVESAGNLLSLFSKKSNQDESKKIFDIPFSQFAKIDVEYTKQWDLKNNNIIALRGFLGFALPYGNSNDVPFFRSYFAGGANDIRAWRPYSLGPGTSETILDFNEANFKLTFNAEYRFKIYRSFRGALFADVGNIWHLKDDLAGFDQFGFKGFNSFKDMALATGFGLRYDLSMFVIRIDWGFKAHNPALAIERRWFTDFSVNKSVLNFGVNYPF